MDLLQLPPHPNLIPLPPKGCISLNGIPLTNKLKKKDLSHVSPMHVHSALHHLSSYDLYRHSSKLDNLPFLWTSATLWVEGFPSHQDMFSYRCHLCHALHPLDPLSMLSHCTSLWFLQDLFLRAWPSGTWQFVISWWSFARPGERRNLIRTLVPASLHTKLKTSMGMTPEQLSAFLVHRPPTITTAVHTSGCRTTPLRHFQPFAQESTTSALQTPSTALLSFQSTKNGAHHRGTLHRHPYH